MALESGNKSIPIVVGVTDADIASATKEINAAVEIKQYDKVQVPLRDAMIEVLTEEFSSILRSYVDPERYLKTLINFGGDTQRIITNWKKDPNDSNKLLIKLLTPLDFDFDVGDTAFINREVANTIVDTIRLELLPQPDTSLWLRPKNTEVKSFITDTELLNIYNRRVTNQTLNTIGINLTGSGNIISGYSFEDDILRRWYTDDYRSVELNVDYTNYENFVSYGSAKLRLDSFKQKLTSIINLQTQYALTSSISTTAAALLEPAVKRAALEKENIIRSFDGYERYLYYQSGSAYTASAYWTPNKQEYHFDGTWPKDASGSLYHPTSSQAVSWYEIQSGIAVRYDQNNPNILINGIPEYIRDDVQSADFIKFTSLIGHFFDNVKIYIDHLPNIYDRNILANKGLSQDLIWDVAKSFGLNLTNPDSAASLYSFITQTNISEKRKQVSELWKRFLHNMPYLNRTRGTRESLRALTNIFGLNEKVIGIRETTTATTGSFQVFDEITNVAKFSTGSFITLPISSSLREVKTIQFRFDAQERQLTTLGVGQVLPTSASWAVQIRPYPIASSNYGRVELVNSTNDVLLSSSYVEMFGVEDYFDVMLRYNGSSVNLQVAQSDGDEILYSSSMSTSTGSLVASWPNTQNFYLGGSGSLSTNNFSGYIDEVRVWGEEIDDSVFYNQVLDPASYVGNNYNSAVESLWVRLSFNKGKTTGSINSDFSGGSILNESPYRNKDGVSDPLLPLLPNITNIGVSGFGVSTLTRTSRKILQYSTNAGAYSYGVNNILIAPPPIFNEIGIGGELILHKNKSIVDNVTRKNSIQTKRYVGFFVSPTDAVNNLIIRSLGTVNINSLSAKDRFIDNGTRLKTLQEYYKTYFGNPVNIAQFVRFFDELSPALFEQASQLVPAKTILNTGIVIEPNLLEHKYIKFDRPVKLSGANTRRNYKFAETEKTYDRDFDITLSTETTLDKPNTAQYGYFADYKTTLDMGEQISTIGDANNSFEANIEQTKLAPTAEYDTLYAEELSLVPEMPQAEIDAGLLVGATITELKPDDISGDYNYYVSSPIQTVHESDINSNVELFDSDIDKLSYIKYLQDYENLSWQEAREKAVSYQPGNIINVYELLGLNKNLRDVNLINEIPPRSDFNDLGVTNFFIKSNAIYYFENVRKEIVGFNQYNFLTGADATWSFGKRYNRNDVVVQLGGTGSDRYFNGKLFRYIAQDAPSVSYNFPSQDKNRWAPIFYKGKAVQTPYRLIFDTYRTENIENINLLPITRVSINRPILEPNRYISRIPFSSFDANSIQSGSLVLQGSTVALFGINVGVVNTPSTKFRIRFYDTNEHKDADGSRPFGTEPIGNHGVLLDMMVESGSVSTVLGLYPPPILINNEAISPNTTPILYYNIEELGGNSYGNGFNIILNYFAIEAPIQLPVGYLPRHYRFYRDTLLSTKRRNYIGCLQTQDTTTDGREPVEVTSTAGTTITVSPNILQSEENLGGINLNVN